MPRVRRQPFPNTRHRHQEFIRFRKLIDKQTPAELDLHLIADHYATHKHPQVKSWFKRHPRFHLHSIPTSGRMKLRKYQVCSEKESVFLPPGPEISQTHIHVVRPISRDLSEDQARRLTQRHKGTQFYQISDLESGRQR